MQGSLFSPAILDYPNCQYNIKQPLAHRDLIPVSYSGMQIMAYSSFEFETKVSADGSLRHSQGHKSLNDNKIISE